jgi:SAM-dependent methyltransferase
MPGEKDVIRTFSSEWVNYDWDGQTYWNLTPDEMYRCMHFMLDLDRRPVRNKLVLEVGIGIGGIADYMARSEGCELVGVDLGYAVDVAYRHFGQNRFFHIVQASAFALPFQESAFDLVFSQGVIHHTFSTKAAFDHICELPKIGGRLYIWVYSPYDEQRSWIRRAMMRLETLIRPVCWRLPERLQTVVLLPIVPLYLIHQNLLVKRDGSGYIKYGWREALHAARDRFTPRYVQRHSDEEVCSWFRAAGYTELQCASRRKRPAFVPVSFVTCTGVDGVRRHAGDVSVN